MATKIIISTDCALDAFWHDPDDSLALVFLLSDPSIEVEAIITTYGNTSENNAYLSIENLLGEIGEQTKIVRGAKNNKDQCLAVREFVSGLKDLDKYWLLSIGPSTNLRAINIDDLLLFKKISVMGGALGRGNIPPFFTEEFNFFKDRVSAMYLLAARSIELVTLDTTKEIFLQPEIVEKIVSKWPVLGRKIKAWDLMKRLLLMHGSNPHDLIAALLLTDPDVFKITTARLALENGKLCESKSGVMHNVYRIKDPSLIYKKILAKTVNLDK